MSFKVPNHYPDSLPSKHFRDCLIKTKKDHHLITLSGPCGTGKTFDACAWLNHIKTFHKRSGLYIKCSDVWRMTPEELYEISMKKCIVLDDYGKKQSVGNLERISNIIDQRIEKEYPYTIITTNILADIRNIDPRLVSRLNQGVIIDYSGMPDRRIN